MQIPSPRLVFLSFVLCMFSQTESIAQLDRVDENWFIGNQQTTISDIEKVFLYRDIGLSITYKPILIHSL